MRAAVAVAAAAAVYMRPQQPQSLTYLTHIHKTGGSSLCATAKQLGMRTPLEYPGRWGNCNFNCEQYSLLYGGNRSASTTARLDLGAYDFVANEAQLVTLHSALPRSRPFVHLVVLRAPCQRTISHYLQEVPIFQQPFACKTARCSADRLDAGEQLINSSFGSWFRLRRHNSFGIGCRTFDWYEQGTTTLDNFQTRMLCGPRCSRVRAIQSLTQLCMCMCMRMSMSMCMRMCMHMRGSL